MGASVTNEGCRTVWKLKSKNTLTSTKGDNKSHINADTDTQEREQNSLGLFSTGR